jgi:dTDP-glucose 4,6-dehydratase
MSLPRTVLVTGGAGFIGSAVCRHLLASDDTRGVVLDKLTYAANPAAIGPTTPDRFRLVVGDIGDRRLVDALLAEERVTAIMHLAAETHVDRSIAGPAAFVDTNIVGTFQLLEAALAHWRGLDAAGQGAFRFHHISTDEVFGDLPFDDSKFSEETPYAPSSPYSASKAASDHLVRAWHRTYGLPVVLSNCSNNYGPWQHAEKLIPLTITNALAGKPLPIYGTGANVRDWLHVDDHAGALDLVCRNGGVGESYAIGAREEHNNVSVVARICDMLDDISPAAAPLRRLITFVTDRAGHDMRYAIDPSKIEGELGWRPAHSFADGLRQTIEWYAAERAAARTVPVTVHAA